MTLADLRQKLLPDGPALDIHVHPLNCFGSYRVSSPGTDAERLVSAARKSGVTRMCVFSLYETTPYEPTPVQCRLANDYVLRMRDAEPEAILPFCYVTPAYPDESAAEIERCVGGQSMAGVKLWVARRATDPGLDPIMEAAVAYGATTPQLCDAIRNAYDRWKEHPGALCALAYGEIVANKP